MNLLITGGAGFIGRYVARESLAQGHTVRILDNFSPQVHGELPADRQIQTLTAFILEHQPDAGPRLAITQGDAGERAILATCLAGQHAVVHLAAETGTGQSMYDVSRYERVNLGITALLMELLASGGFKDVNRVVLASSRAVYGEGQYSCARCGPVFPPTRDTARLLAGHFDPLCPLCNSPITAAPTGEQAPRVQSSFYGLTKAVQEDILRLFAGNMGFSAYLLRFQNVYGPMQSLTNPYTGILSIFSTLARSNQTIRIFEDGQESRDFVYVEDIARAVVACLAPAQQGVFTLNLGTGEGVSVQAVAESITRTLGSRSEIMITGQFRAGDIRHAIADITAARKMLGYRPTVHFGEGIARFLDWVRQQPVAASRYEESLRELAHKGLLQTGATTR